MADRGIQDEAFVRRALDEATFDMGRWIANQSFFNHSDQTPILPKLKAAIITSAAVYVEKYGLEERIVEDALAINTCGEARAFIDTVRPLLPDRIVAD